MKKNQDNQHKSDAQPEKDAAQPEKGIVKTHVAAEVDEMYALFNSFPAEEADGVAEQQIMQRLQKIGILDNDGRLKNVKSVLHEIPFNAEGKRVVQYPEFEKIVGSANIVRSALIGEVAVPEFDDFCQEITRMYHELKAESKGKVASYIPQLAEVNPDLFAISICTISGQRFSIGDVGVDFSLQSVSKPITYCMVLEELGEEIVHQHVDKEPSGLAFNELKLKSRNGGGSDGHGGDSGKSSGPAAVPHNPLINSGAIMCTSLVRRALTMDKRLEAIIDTWRALTHGIDMPADDATDVERSFGRKPRFNAEIFLGERRTADRNNALAYFMRENKAFMNNDQVDVQEVLELYFQTCSIEINSEQMAVAAATLANAGVNPLSGKRLFDPHTVRNCLSVMYTCGMYDYSGEFAFQIGLPAKSGVSGGLMVVVPNLMGICIYSPRLDEYGNTCHGVDFCKKLVERFKLHIYDGLVENSNKKDPRKRNVQDRAAYMMELIFAASYGDLDNTMKLHARGVDLSIADYDKRTALHLAASEGHFAVVQYLVNYYKKQGLSISPEDRWGGTPLQDALKGNHQTVAKFLQKEGAV